MTPTDCYRQYCMKGVVSEDPQQLSALIHFDRIYHDLLIESQHRSGLFSYLRRPRLVKGLYLWGGIGIGKTFLMDCFYQSLPFPNKIRMHFYQFMQRVHNELTALQGRPDPLTLLAKRLAKETMVLCFDEFFVSDIADAMLLGRLLNCLFTEGVCLVTTSNIAPDKLYEYGLQREQFIPAIELIKQDTVVFQMQSGVDYRLRHLKEAGIFYTPLNETTTAKMETSFAALTANERIETGPLQVFDRPISVKKRTKSVVWFDFKEICTTPRSQKDYLAIAKQFTTVFISDIPIIQPSEKDVICLFISLVDVFYDARVKLVISAAESVENLYSRGYMILEYTRTHSRLLEMQSRNYFTGEND